MGHALTWSFCEEDKGPLPDASSLYFSLGEKQAGTGMGGQRGFSVLPEPSGKAGLVVLTEGCTREEAVYSIISRSVMAPMAFSRTERMKHFMEAPSMEKAWSFH